MPNENQPLCFLHFPDFLHFHLIMYSFFMFSYFVSILSCFIPFSPFRFMFLQLFHHVVFQFFSCFHFVSIIFLSFEKFVFPFPKCCGFMLFCFGGLRRPPGFDNCDPSGESAAFWVVRGVWEPPCGMFSPWTALSWTVFPQTYFDLCLVFFFCVHVFLNSFLLVFKTYICFFFELFFFSFCVFLSFFLSFSHFP